MSDVNGDQFGVTDATLTVSARILPDWFMPKREADGAVSYFRAFTVQIEYVQGSDGWGVRTLIVLGKDPCEQVLVRNWPLDRGDLPEWVRDTVMWFHPVAGVAR